MSKDQRKLPRRRKLNKAEAEWLERLEALLLNPPSDRIGFYTTGDACLNAYDRRFEKEIHRRLDEHEDGDFCGAAYHLDIEFKQVKSAVNIHSTAG